MTTKLYIATPCYGKQLFTDYLSSFTNSINTFMQHGIQVKLQTIGNESLITRGRNTLVAQFLKEPGEYTHLMFIDADIAWDPESIVEMLKADKDIIGGVYPKKGYDWENLSSPAVCNLINKLNHPQLYDQYKPVIEPLLLEYVLRPHEGVNPKDIKEIEEVDYVGTGFMLIKREVILKMQDNYPELKYKIGRREIGLECYGYALFDCIIYKEEYLSEDYVFCKRWTDIGGKIHGYRNAKLRHTGVHTYNGNFEHRVACLNTNPYQ